MRKFCLGFVATLLLAGVLALASGWVAAVGTFGNSMAPRMEAGDLVLITQSPSYEVGDVVAYASADLDQTVLHRVVAVEDGRYTFRGDNNDFDDPEEPTSDQLIGKELLHIPQGQVWIDRLTSPLALAVIAFGLLAVGGATTRSLHRRRKRPMAQHAAGPRPTGGLGGVSPRIRTAALIAASITMLGLVLAALSWTRPATASEAGASPDAARMTFSYSADVPASPAYEGTTVTSPAPLFRRLVEEVALTYTYRGEAARISVAAELSAASGWQTEVPLKRAVTSTGPEHTATINLDLDALAARANAAAAAIAIPAEQVEVTILATVKTTAGRTFKPGLTFVLSPLKLELAAGPSSLTVAESTSTPDEIGAPTLNLIGQHIAISTLRTTSAVLALGGLLALGAIMVLPRLGRNDEHTAIQRQYAALLLQVEPIPSPATRPVVDVVDFPTLARLAERYGLLILHWTRSNIETFIVQDDGITYRYRIPATADEPAHPTDTNHTPGSTMVKEE